MIDLKAKLEPALVANVARAEPYAWDGECRHLRRSMSVCSSRLGHHAPVSRATTSKRRSIATICGRGRPRRT